MTDRAADDRVGDTTTNHQRRASAAALAATATAAAMAEARAMVAVKVMRTSDNDDDDAMTKRHDDADDANDDADGEEGGRRDCPAAAGDRTTRFTGWAARRTASSGCHRALPPRQRRLPLVLEDHLVLCHSFVLADRPAPLPATMTTTTRTRTTVSKEQRRCWPPSTQEQGDAPAAGSRQHNH